MPKLKKSDRKKAELTYIVQEVTKSLVELIAKHYKYFGATTFAIIDDYNEGGLDYEQLVDNIYKDVCDYESAL